MMSILLKKKSLVPMKLIFILVDYADKPETMEHFKAIVEIRPHTLIKVHESWSDRKDH